MGARGVGAEKPAYSGAFGCLCSYDALQPGFRLLGFLLSFALRRVGQLCQESLARRAPVLLFFSRRSNDTGRELECMEARLSPLYNRGTNNADDPVADGREDDDGSNRPVILLE